MKQTKFILPAFVIALAALASCTKANFGRAVEQADIARVEIMPAMPTPYKILDWKQKAKDFDSFVFDFNTKIPAGPQIWIDNSQRNIPQVTFGLYTAIKDVRQGPDKNGGEFHESLNSFHTLISAGLNGIDKTSQNGYNYVKMVQNYFNSANGWNIMMNNTCPEVALLGGGYGRDWWYDVYPNILYYAVCDIFPGVENSDKIQRTIAERFLKADLALNGNYDYSYFDYSTMEGKINHIPLQQDAAGGHAWVLYAAYKKYGNPEYLEHAKSATKALDSQKESRFYEILLPMGIYTAARLNAEQACNFDIAKMLDWVFDGCKSPTGRTGWGIMAERWGDYDVHGLQGSITDEGGYAFLMNSIDLAWPFIPMVKYQPQYARAMGRWMLNNTNACRLFFPDQIPDSHQCLPNMQDYTKSIIAYEGLRYKDSYYEPKRMQNTHPVALGDGPKWHPDNPKESMFSVYSSSAVGILGAIVETTDVEGILRLDCNATDFYAEKPYPVFLMYNPLPQTANVTYTVKNGKSDLFDIVSKTYLARSVRKSAKISIPSDNSVIVVEIPAGEKITSRDGKLYVNDNIISYR